MFILNYLHNACFYNYFCFTIFTFYIERGANYTYCYIIYMNNKRLFFIGRYFKECLTI